MEAKKISKRMIRILMVACKPQIEHSKHKIEDRIHSRKESAMVIK